jgi:hypothetical protein
LQIAKRDVSKLSESEAEKRQREQGFNVYLGGANEERVITQAQRDMQQGVIFCCAMSNSAAF